MVLKHVAVVVSAPEVFLFRYNNVEFGITRYTATVVVVVLSDVSFSVCSAHNNIRKSH